MDEISYTVDDFQQISEGKATILFPRNNEVFYNPVQQFNRDMSIAAIKTWRDVTNEAKQQRYERSTNPSKTPPSTQFTLLEALAASGLRSVRYAKEIDGIDHIVANDLLPDAVESIRRNVHFNGLSPQLVRAHQGDAVAAMHSLPRFGVVDLDPYGSAAPFVDGAIHAVENGGLICVTCTDLAILASNNHPETCFGKYGGNPLKAGFCHEMALRLVLNSLQQAAGRYRRYIEPLLSCSIDFYVRVFVRVHDRPLLAKTVASQTGVVYHCRYCGTFATQPFGTIDPGKGQSTKYRIAAAPTAAQSCETCGSGQEIGGPCWLGPLHNKQFVQRMYDAVCAADQSVYGTQPRMRGMLKVILEELDDTPLHYDIATLCSAVRCVCPPLTKLNSALLNAGYRVSGVHTHQGSIKTDAPPHVIWDAIRAHVRETGRSSRIAAGSPADRILSAQPTTDISFEPHKDADPESRRTKLVRYQINPEKFWGPKARHSQPAKPPATKRKQGVEPGSEAAQADESMDLDAKKPKAN
ncbi:RNA methyltransferase tRNA(m5U54)methyltransferase [Coemansia sp. RSA 1290]|nr:RNA methyltransferase tRNA(m5U54)methyltransferase [Coemansia sp. RSA 1290]